MAPSDSADRLPSRPALRDNRCLHLRRPIPAPASAGEHLKPLRTLTHRIVTRDYHRSSASLIAGARKVDAVSDQRKVGSAPRLRSRFSEEQIIAVLKEQEAGMATADVCRRHGISSATFYKWKSKYGGLEVSDARRLRQLEQENARLKKLLADSMLDNAMLKEISTKKF